MSEYVFLKAAGVLLGKAVSRTCSRPPLGLGHGMSPYQEPPQPVQGFATLCGSDFSCDRMMSTLFSLLKVCASYGTWPAHCYVCRLRQARGQGSFACGRRGVHMRRLPRSGCLGRPTGREGPKSTSGAGLAPSLFCADEVLFHPPLNYDVF